MFCENCGSKIDSSHKFCIKCGRSISADTKKTSTPNLTPQKEDKWWHRLSRVFYIVLYLPLLLIVPLVWSENTPSSYYSYYSKETTYSGSYGEAFWYSLITLIIYLVVVRLIKITFQYIVSAKRPEWGKEFKRLY